MLFGIGWCVLRSSQHAYATATIHDVDSIDARIDSADRRLWSDFRVWMTQNPSALLLWTLHERHNNHAGVLQCFVSRNHRGTPFWSMIDWIAEHGPGSYGLFYVQDDEDDGTRPGARAGMDFSNVFRVYRILNGRGEELPDPFFGDIVPGIEFPYPET